MPQVQQQHSHKPGMWKQQNKEHKNGRHRSNREIQTANKGKVSLKVMTKSKNKDLNRDQRRHLMKQKRKTKREESIAIKRSIGSENTPPILVLVHSSDGYFNVKPIIQLFENCCDEAVVSTHKEGSVHVSIPKFKLRYNFIHVADGDLFGMMDAAKIADLLIVVHNLATGPEEDLLSKDERLRAIYFHFLPTTIHVIHGLEGVPVKRRAEIKKNVMKAIESRFPDEKLHNLDTSAEAIQFLHILGNCKRKVNSYKKNRPQILGESVDFVPKAVPAVATGSESNETVGKLIVTGYVRNRTLDVNQLVHIPGHGDFQIEMIESSTDPHPMRKDKNHDKGMDIDQLSRKLIQKSDPMLQEPLEFENELDPMEGEQNYPTAEEIAAAAEELKQRKLKIKKVTKGTSDYQAAWIIEDEDKDDADDDDDDEFESDDDDDEEDLDMEPSDPEDFGDDVNNNDDNESIATMNEDTITVAEENEERYDEKIDIDQEEEERKKIKEAREHQMFPDEVDTPMDVPARVRFARFRGLQSFAHSDWDAKENLPSDYSRIFQFENFIRTKARILKELKQTERKEEKDGAAPGTHVHVTLTNVPKTVYDCFKANPLKPLIMFGLLAHEQRMSVLNFVLHKSPSFQGVVKSKERLIFHVGCRRFCANPIFSAHTNGDKFKYERFLKDEDVTVASVYAPITFPPASVVVFKESGGSGGYSEVGSVRSGQSERRVRFDSSCSEPQSGLQMVATGSLLSVNPDRLVIKRVVLSGHPFKINRRSAVIRYMFYNKEDINWFKPVELRTKFGRKGHIKESLGTHGHMKVGFDRPINSMDTVLMNLYKRVFPKWTYDPIVPEPKLLSTETFDEEKME